MTIDQCKAHILAELANGYKSYWWLRGVFRDVPNYLFATALKQLILEGEVIRRKHLHYPSVTYFLKDDKSYFADDGYSYLVPIDCPLNQ